MDDMQKLRNYWQTRQYPLPLGLWVIPGYNDQPLKCPYCEEGMVYPTNGFNLGWCNHCHYFFGWAYVNLVEWIIFP